MRKIFLFIMVSLDGFFEGENHNLSWHNVDTEFNKFAAKQMQDAGAIFFGRKTYELMESFWPGYNPTDTYNKIVRKQLITLPKYVFSKSLQNVHPTKDWRNITLFHEINREMIKNLTNQKGKDIIILASSDLCISLLNSNLLDEVRIMFNPVILGSGKRLFEGFDKKCNFKLTHTRKFLNGKVLLTYTVQ